MQDKGATFDVFVNLISQIVSIEVDATTLNRDTTLTNDLMLDSISLISLMALTEERFGVNLTEHAEAMANMRTIGDVLDLIESLSTSPA